MKWMVPNGSGVHRGDKAGCDKGDYSDTNKKNNTWGNLRLATSSQNKMNVRGGPDRGLRFFKTRGWQASLMKKGVVYSAGHYQDKDEARAARRQLETEHFGKFACLRSS